MAKGGKAVALLRVGVFAIACVMRQCYSRSSSISWVIKTHITYECKYLVSIYIYRTYFVLFTSKIY